MFILLISILAKFFIFLTLCQTMPIEIRSILTKYSYSKNPFQWILLVKKKTISDQFS